MANQTQTKLVERLDQAIADAVAAETLAAQLLATGDRRRAGEQLATAAQQYDAALATAAWAACAPYPRSPCVDQDALAESRRRIAKMRADLYL